MIFMATENYILDRIDRLYECIADLQNQINYLKTKIDVLEIKKEDKVYAEN